ncbi:MAG: Hsp20/alpha crystallin family protein [Bdellovibrionales bacterium]|nr:Hsp20/alpha crystallin family protein [Bdellovibrionales bacterium]
MKFKNGQEAVMSIGDIVPWHWGSRQVPVRKHSRGSSRDISLSSLLDDFFSDFPFDTPTKIKDVSGFQPNIDIKDSPEQLTVFAEVPGMEEKDLDITLNVDSLVLEGTKRTDREEDREGFHYVERRSGSFRRVIPLNFEVDEDKVDAKFKNGVLTIALPKTSKAKSETRKISVKAG